MPYGPRTDQLVPLPKEMSTTMSSRSGWIGVPVPLEMFVWPGFLPDHVCDELIGLMSERLSASTVMVEGQPEAPDRRWRTSRSCNLGHLQHPLVIAVDTYIAGALRQNPASSEGLQGQWYDVGEEYKAHHDYFHTADQKARYALPHMGNQRTWTAMIYLNTPKRGGETAFPELNLAFIPKRGFALLWNNLLPNGEGNPHTIHHARPVEAGFKAIVTKWFRGPMVPPSQPRRTPDDAHSSQSGSRDRSTP